MTRYECYKASVPEVARFPGYFHSWLTEQIAQWSEVSGRAKELRLEHKENWQFPVLVSKAHNSEFDAWLNAKVEGYARA